MTDEITYHLLNTENAHLLEGTDIFDNPVMPDQLAAFVANPLHKMVFATLGSTPVGMAFGAKLFYPDKPPEFFINEVGVNEDMRLRGIGAKLTQMLIDIGCGMGCPVAWVATENDNQGARGLYCKLQARETEDIVVYDWGDSD